MCYEKPQKYCDNNCVIMLTKKINFKFPELVPMTDVRKWICEQSPTVLRHAAEIVKRSSLKKLINDRIKLFEDVLTVCICYVFNVFVF